MPARGAPAHVLIFNRYSVSTYGVNDLASLSAHTILVTKIEGQVPPLMTLTGSTSRHACRGFNRLIHECGHHTLEKNKVEHNGIPATAGATASRGGRIRQASNTS